MEQKKLVQMRLNRLDGLRQSLQSVQKELDILEGALQVLNPEERLVAEQLFIYPDKGNVQRLCQILGVEQSSVYRRRDKVLQKVGIALGIIEN